MNPPTCCPVPVMLPSLVHPVISTVLFCVWLIHPINPPARELSPLFSFETAPVFVQSVNFNVFADVVWNFPTKPPIWIAVPVAVTLPLFWHSSIVVLVATQPIKPPQLLLFVSMVVLLVQLLKVNDVPSAVPTNAPLTAEVKFSSPSSVRFFIVAEPAVVRQSGAARFEMVKSPPSKVPAKPVMPVHALPDILMFAVTFPFRDA